MRDKSWAGPGLEIKVSGSGDRAFFRGGHVRQVRGKAGSGEAGALLP